MKMIREVFGMKKMLSFLLVAIIILGLCSCSSKTQVTAEEVYYAIETAGFPVHSPTVITEETDSNELLGRPGQYTSKVEFYDISGNAGSSDKCVIEVFASSKDAKTRFEYVKSLSESIAMLAEYDYLNDTVILRIDNSVSPANAQKYEEWFLAQDFSDFSVAYNEKDEEISQKTEQIFTEPTGDTVELVIPKYLIDDEEFDYWVEAADSHNVDSSVMTVKIDGDLVIVTVEREFYDQNLSLSSFTARAMEEFGEFSSFKRVAFSDDFMTANITVDKSKYSSKEQYDIIKLADKYITERNAFFRNFEPSITIKLYGEGENDPFYTFRYKRPAERIHELSVDDITDAFSGNESAARQKYIGKYVEITGEIQTIEKSDSKTYILVKSLENPDNPIWVQGNIDLDYYENDNHFQKGSEITIIGKCIGYDFFVVVDDCVMF